MKTGLVAELEELIGLKQHVQSKGCYLKWRTNQGPGQTDKRILGRGMDFAEVRNYQPGDEIRHMDWRVTARTGRPYIKLYQEERERPFMLVCEFGASLYFGTKIALKSVIAARLAALIAWTVVQQEDRIGGIIHTAAGYRDWLPRARHNGVLPILSSLSTATQLTYDEYNGQENSNLSSLLERLTPRLRPGSLIIILSDFYTLDDAAEKQLIRLRQHYPLAIYSIWDPFEISPPLPGRYPITNGQDFDFLDMTCPHFRKNYQSYCEERRQRLVSICKQLQIQETPVITGMDLPNLVQTTFARSHYGR
ncbi:MAG: DUF58 domain-containing protein [Legionella sp.]|nr:DUF58 domain-containing protein [Legionella sp.]